jgi:hypothetical protein
MGRDLIAYLSLTSDPDRTMSEMFELLSIGAEKLKPEIHFQIFEP